VSDGIDDPAQVLAFVQDGYVIVNTWHTAAERAEALIAALNVQLDVEGVPGVTYSTAALGSGNAEFLATSWAIALDGDSLDPYRTEFFSEEEKADMLRLVYHEGRHAEQWFRIARMRAGMGEDADVLAAAMGIPGWVAACAAADPIIESNAETREAEEWNDSLFGYAAEFRSDMLSETGRTEEQHEAYMALPEEDDAWAVDRAVQQAYDRYTAGE
jgi:hypothetical protein